MAYGRCDSVRNCLWILVRPDADDSPSLRLEVRGIPQIAAAILFDLGAPVLTVRRRGGPVVGAAVPEAAIYEDRDTLLGEHDIRPDIGPPLQADRLVHAEPETGTVQG
jgi:hypothetical protein